jgi:hypothetical protein
MCLRRRRCESRGDVDGITKRREVIDGGAKPGRPNECHAGMDSRPSWNGARRRAAGLCGSLGQVDCGCNRHHGVVRPADSPEKSPITSLPTTFVNDAVMSNDRIGGQSIEAVEDWWNSAGRIRSPMAVEPRISENSRVIGISTPVN